MRHIRAERMGGHKKGYLEGQKYCYIIQSEIHIQKKPRITRGSFSAFRHLIPQN